MTFLPIVLRELRVAARGKALYRARFWTAVTAVGLGSYLMLMFRNTSRIGGGAGLMIFHMLTGVGWLYCALLARNTADCISDEKREGTLGLLFLTDLKGYDIVLGKLCANSLKSFYGFIATFPVVSCVLVMGGVTGVELFLVALELLNLFFFAHAAGLLVSAVSRDSRRANGGAACVLIFFLLVLPVLAAWLKNQSHPSAAEVLQLFSPIFAYEEASASATQLSGYWTSLLLVHLCAWFFLALASLLLPRCWQDKPGRINLRWNARFRQWCFGPPAFRERLRLKLIGINPFFWLVSRNRLGAILVWGFLGLVFCGWFWALCESGLADSISWFVMTILITHTILKFWMASEACSHLEEQRRTGALEILLSCTPLSVEEIIAGQWRALRRLFLAPVVAVLAFDVLLIILSQDPWHRPNLIGALSGNPRRRPDPDGNFILFVFVAMILLCADALAIGWVGIWRAMAERRPRRAAGQTIMRVIILPCILMGIFGAVLASGGAPVLLVLWFLIGMITDAILSATARDQLYAQFRELSAFVREEPLGLLGNLGRMFGK